VGVATLALVALLVAPGALLAQPDPGPPGNNGTVKIHEGMDHSDPPPTDRNHEPHVCTFHIHGFNFDSGETGVWRIYDWAPTGDGTLVDSGSWTADADGEWMSGLKELPDGHYRLVWEIPGDGNDDKDNDTTADKHKMFWVECPGEQPATPTPTATATGTEAAATPTMTATATATATGTELAATPTPPGPTPTATGTELAATPTAPAPGETPTATATGGQLPATATPTTPAGGQAPGVTPPETAADTDRGASGSTPLGLVLLLLAAGISGLLLLTPAPRRTRR
jgi:hypothetical protein